MKNKKTTTRRRGRTPIAPGRATASSIRERRRSTEAHLRMSLEDWRAYKRAQWKAVMHALEAFNYGSAYTPAGNDQYELHKAAQRISDAMEADWLPLSAKP